MLKINFLSDKFPVCRTYKDNLHHEYSNLKKKKKENTELIVFLISEKGLRSQMISHIIISRVVTKNEAGCNEEVSYITGSIDSYGIRICWG
jgi:hypothetical protein